MSPAPPGTATRGPTFISRTSALEVDGKMAAAAPGSGVAPGWKTTGVGPNGVGGARRRDAGSMNTRGIARIDTMTAAGRND
jgi:hypothetical protein